ncbi:MAG: cell division protein SepF [Capsulimonadales bacterium]|nr:cell division protein SepF [Capsulimonadales bacterium]
MQTNGGLRSHFNRWLDSVRGRNEEEGVYEPEGTVLTAAAPPPAAPRRDTFRVASIKGSITITQVSNFGDTQKVADRLKAGEPQVVNLEKTAPEVAERLVDFLNGVTYALDGYVEKVADQAYLFTPSHIAIHAESPEQAPPKPFFDR